MLATTLMPLLMMQLAAQNDLGGGTQPGTLTIGLQSNATCATCHSSTTIPNLPSDTYRGSMMHLASQDPFFLAAWEIAFDDDEEVAGLCLRCHFPKGYLADRHEPHDGTNLQASDEEGIACDLCHRMIAPTPTDPGDPLSGLLLSNTQVFIANDTTKRGPFSGLQTTGHGVQQSALFTDSRLCAQCHEVTNTLSERRGLDGGVLSAEMPIERTYTEWKNSAYSVAGADFKSCMDCHMAEIHDAGMATSSNTGRTIRSHRLVGGNTLAPKMMEWQAGQPGADPFLVAAAPALDEVAAAAQEQLESAATLEVLGAAVDGRAATLTVRTTNLSGHKLPTGYAEGRRMFLGSIARSAAGAVLRRTGNVDPATSSFFAGEGPAKLWQVDLGKDGEPSFHFALVDQVLFDSRIPPKGFRATPDTAPVDATVALLGDGTYAHWDDATVPLGETDCFPIVVDVLLQYQTASGEYLRFLVANAPTAGPDLQDAWDAVGGGVPVVMKALRVAVHADGTIDAPAAPSYACEPPVLDDAGTVVVDDDGGTTAPVDDAGAMVDGGVVDDPLVCACAAASRSSPAAAAVGLVIVAALARRRRR